MKSPKSIIAVVPPGSENSIIAPLLRNARYLAKHLDCSIHVFAPNVADIEAKSSGGGGPVIFHSLSEPLFEQLRQAVDEYDCEFILMPKEIHTGRIARASLSRQVLEGIPSPVLLIPSEREFTALPIRSFLVPLSGERRISEALGFALKTANRIKAPVDLVHVAAPDRPCICLQTLESVGDEFQHEYPELMERIISEACPYSEPRQRANVRWFHHVSGKAADEIRKVMESEPGAVLVIEWKGVLERGHAKVVKDVAQEQEYPIFFVKAGRVRKSQLKVGNAFEAA